MKKHFLFLRIWSLAAFAVFFLLCSFPVRAQSSSGGGQDMARVFREAGLPLLRQRVSPRDFSLPLASAPGETVRLSSLKGKVVFLNFWATWCPPCRVEMPSMEALYNKYKERGLEILAVNCGESAEEVTSFMRNNNFTFPTVLDSDNRMSNIYGIQGIPTSFLIDREGYIVARLVGSIDWNTSRIHAALECLID